MQASLALVLLLLAAPPVRAGDEVPLPQSQTDQARVERPDTRLIRLERELSRKLQEPGLDRRSPEYRRFVDGFRARLDQAMTTVPPMPENKGLHARIVARLGESERDQALAELDRALEGNLGSPALHRAKGQILYEGKDYPGAAESALKAWEHSGHTDKVAWALYQMTKGRVAPNRTDVMATPGAMPPPRPTTVADDDAGKPYKLTVKTKAIHAEVPILTGKGDFENPPPASPYWPWPAGWGLALLGTAGAVKRKLDGEGLTVPVMTLGAGISLLAFSTAFPPGAALTTPEGVQLILAPVTTKIVVGTTGSALTAKGAVETGRALVSNASGSQPTDQPARTGPSLENPESLRGADPEDVENLIPKDWIKGPLRKGAGTRYLNPQKPDESILVEHGWPGANDPLHRGPYVRISRNGRIIRVPLKGNPSLP